MLYSCTHMTTVGVKGLARVVCGKPDAASLAQRLAITEQRRPPASATDA